MMDLMPDTSGETNRAAAMGITVRVNDALDRVSRADDTRIPGTACPTCDDGVRTIANPRRCKACTAEGL